MLPTGTVPSLGKFTNKTEPSKQGSINVLLLDQLHTPWKDWEQSWPAILKFSKSLRPGDQIAVYALDSVYGLRVIQEYTAPTSDLVDKIRALHGFSLPRPGIGVSTEPSGHFSQRPSDGLAMPELLRQRTIARPQQCTRCNSKSHDRSSRSKITHLVCW